MGTDFVGAAEDLLDLVSGDDDDDVSGEDFVGADGADDPIALLEGVSGDDDDDDDVSGDDDDVYGDVGAKRRRRAKAKAKSKKLVKRAAIGKALLTAALRKQGQKKRRAQELSTRAQAGRQPTIRLGIDSNVSLGGVAIAAAPAQVTITTAAVDKMRLIDFQPRAGIAGDFLIHDIRVQRTSLLSGAQPIPADHFLTPDRAPLEAVVLYPGTLVTMRLENLAAAPRRFVGTFSGIDLDKDE